MENIYLMKLVRFNRYIVECKYMDMILANKALSDLIDT